jgi:hypothetical protein
LFLDFKSHYQEYLFFNHYLNQGDKAEEKTLVSSNKRNDWVLTYLLRGREKDMNVCL